MRRYCPTDGTIALVIVVESPVHGGIAPGPTSGGQVLGARQGAAGPAAGAAPYPGRAGLMLGGSRRLPSQKEAASCRSA